MKRVAAIVCLLGFIGVLKAHDNEEFQWTEEKSKYADIQLEIAGPGIIKQFTQVSGKIISHPDHIAYVIPKVEGTVYTIEKNLGDCVKKGDVLLTIESQEVAEVKMRYLLALNQVITKKKFFEREEALRGISKEQDYLDAKLASDQAHIEHECALQDLYFLGFTEGEIFKIQKEDPQKTSFLSAEGSYRWENS